MRIFFLVLLFAFVSSVQAGETVLTTRDFAYGYMLKVQEEGAVYSLPLPNQVYRNVRRADLGDIRVFNGSGEVVPHAVRKLENDDKELPAVEEIPFFPLYKQQEAGAEGNLSLSVRRNSDGTIIDIDSRPFAAPEDSPSGYLLDMSGLRREPGSLELFWQTTPETTTGTVRLQQSGDLQRWIPLVSKATLVDLEYAGNKVVQRSISLPGKAQKYIKISWQPGQPSFKLTRVRMVARPRFSAMNYQWVSLYNGELEKSEGLPAFAFSSSYRLPVKSVRIRFPDPNSIVSGVVQSRPDAKADWRSRCQGIFYTLQLEGEQIRSEPCRFSTITDREWRLVLQQDGAGLAVAGKSPVLELGWSSDELLFVARGTPPFLLAYGSGMLEHEKGAVNGDMILQALQREPSEMLVKKATLGKHLELSGETALQPPPPPKPWKIWILWSVLLIGLLLMAGMAWSLLREFRESGE